MSEVVELVVRILQMSSFLVLAAIGLAIIFGMMGVINLAHGGMITLGAYAAWVVTDTGVNFWIGFAIAPVVVGVVGYVMERLVIHRLYERPLDTLLATWGFALVIRELIKLIFGTTARSITNPFPAPVVLAGASFSAYRLFIVVLAAAALVVAYLIFKQTEFGLRSRAVIQNDEMASLLGVEVDRVYQYTFVIGSALAGLAGATLAPLISVNPRMGLEYLISSFFVVIVGGVGQIFAGTLSGGLFIGGGEAVVSNYTTRTFAKAVVFILAVIVIRLRPEGLFQE